MTIKNGDFILLNYTCKVKESGDIIETTIEKIARDAKLHEGHLESVVFEPSFIIVGEGWVPKGLDESLAGMEPGKTATVELSPEKGYGARDPAKLRLVPLRRFTEKGLTPVPGAQLELEGKPALVRSVGAGRVQVDYNHPLAGKTLIYEVSPEKIIEDLLERVKAIVHKRIPTVKIEKFSLSLNEGAVTIDAPEEAFFLEGLQLAKQAITADVEKYLKEISKIAFLEVFKKPAAAAPPQPAQAQAQSGSSQTR